MDQAWPPPPYLPLPAPAVGDDGVRRYDGITYAKVPGFRPLLLDLAVPPARGPVPLVIWIHGGGWLEGDRRYPPPTVPAELLFGSVLDAGLAVATIDYRLSLEAPFPAQLHDVKAAIRYLREFGEPAGIDTARIGLWGESAGGHLAALAALSSDEGEVGVPGKTGPVAAVVDWYGPADLAPLLAAPFPPPPMGAADWPFPNPYTTLVGEADPAAASPVAQVDASAPPFLLVHGTEDQLVPYAQSELLADRLTAAGATATVMPITGADHIFLGSPDVGKIVAESIEFLVGHLGVNADE